MKIVSDCGFLKIWEYREIKVSRSMVGTKIYEFEDGNIEEFDLLELLNKIGERGWELVGEVEGKIIVRLYWVNK